MSATWTSDLLRGIATYLDEAGVGVWRELGPAYMPGETGIVLGEVPPTPDRIVGLFLYDEGSEDGVGTTEPRLQVRTRAPGPNTAVADLADAVREALRGLTRRRFGTAYVAQISLYNGGNLGADLGADGNARHERFTNYDLIAGRTGMYR